MDFGLGLLVFLFELGGPPLMVKGSKAFPLTASHFAPLPRYESNPGHGRKFPVTWAVVFASYSVSLHILQLPNRDLAAI